MDQSPEPQIVAEHGDETTDNTATTAAGASRPAVLRALHAVNVWRRKRPFWGAIILGFGGYYVMAPMIGASFQMVVHMGMRGASPYLLGGGMIAAAAISLLMPAQRHFPALMAMAFSVLSLPFANLGGWIIGMVLGIIGSGMVFAWTPYSDKQLAKFAERDARKADKKAQRSAMRATTA